MVLIKNVSYKKICGNLPCSGKSLEDAIIGHLENLFVTELMARLGKLEQYHYFKIILFLRQVGVEIN